MFGAFDRPSYTYRFQPKIKGREIFTPVLLPSSIHLSVMTVPHSTYQLPDFLIWPASSNLPQDRRWQLSLRCSRPFTVRLWLCLCQSTYLSASMSVSLFPSPPMRPSRPKPKNATRDEYLVDDKDDREAFQNGEFGSKRPLVTSVWRWSR